MAKPNEIPSHDGACGFCKSDVPIDATVCGRCGARWGTSTGNSPEMVYQDGRIRFILGSFACIGLLVFLLVSVYFESAWSAIALIAGFFLGVPAFFTAIGGLLRMSRSKKLLINWWREA